MAPLPHLVEAFHRDGFVRVPGVFAAAELEALGDYLFRTPLPSPDVLTVGARTSPARTRRLADMSEAELRQSERFLKMHLVEERCLRLMLDPRLFDLVRPLWPGEPLAVHTMYFPKPPGTRGMALHRDTLVPVDPPELAGCMIAVDDMDSENGALEVVPGSHLVPTPNWRPVPRAQSVFFMEYEQPPGLERTLVPLRAGDVLLFHGAMLHASARNDSARWRRSFTCHYVSAAVRSVSEHFNPAFHASGERVVLGELAELAAAHGAMAPPGTAG